MRGERRRRELKVSPLVDRGRQRHRTHGGRDGAAAVVEGGGGDRVDAGEVVGQGPGGDVPGQDVVGTQPPGESAGRAHHDIVAGFDDSATAGGDGDRPGSRVVA